MASRLGLSIKSLQITQCQTQKTTAAVENGSRRGAGTGIWSSHYSESRTEEASLLWTSFRNRQAMTGTIDAEPGEWGAYPGIHTWKHWTIDG